MIPANGLKTGTVFEYQDEPFRVIEYRHTHLGRSSANVRLKIKGLVSGQVLSINFTSDEKFNQVHLDKLKLTFLYADREDLHFENDNGQKYEISRQDAGDKQYYLKKGRIIEILTWEDKPIDINLPPKVKLQVTKAEPAAKGNSATNVFKKVRLETGLTIKVPLFIDKGDTVVVNSDTGEYVSRA